MTKEEARQIIATWLVSSKGTKGQRGYIEGWFDEEDVEAFRMAIEALKAPTENTNTPTDTPTDLISRDKTLNLVLDVCNDVMDECETVTGLCGEEVYTDVREVDAILKCNKRIRNGIRRLPSEPVGNSDTLEWIPCSERLPKELSVVNVTYVNHNPVPYYDFVKDIAFTETAVYYQGDWYWNWSGCKDVLAEYGRDDANKVDKAVEVIAWMPLPKPWEGESDD